MMTTERTHTHDEAQLRRLIDEQMIAICAKDVDRIMSYYAADVVAFDVKPPFQTKGADAWRRIWEECLPCFPESFRIKTRDLNLTISGNLALAHWLFRFTEMEKDHPAAQTWIRITAAYRRTEGGWEITHEHLSVPLDPQTGRAAFTLEP